MKKKQKELKKLSDGAMQVVIKKEIKDKTQLRTDGADSKPARMFESSTPSAKILKGGQNEKIIFNVNNCNVCLFNDWISFCSSKLSIWIK